MTRISTLDNIDKYEILWLTAPPTQYPFLIAPTLTGIRCSVDKATPARTARIRLHYVTGL